MADWDFLGDLFEAMQTHSPLLGRLWLQIMLVFRILILGTVATDLFEDEQEEFQCNTAQPGCKQVCYDQAFPISQYRFWVFHIVLISTPALLFLMYAMHLNAKTKTHHQDVAGIDVNASGSFLGRHGGVSVNPQQDLRVMRLYMLNVGFRFLAEVAFLVGQWGLYGFRVAAQYPCSRFPCPYTVDCFTSRPMEKTIFLCFYFAVGLLSALFSLAELVHVFAKWRRLKRTAARGDEETDTAEEQWAEQQRLMHGGGGGGGGGVGEGAGLEDLPRSWSRGSGSVSRGGKRGHLYSGRGRISGGSSSRGSGRGKGAGGRSSSSRIYSSSTGLKNSRVSSQKTSPLLV